MPPISPTTNGRPAERFQLNDALHLRIWAIEQAVAFASSKPETFDSSSVPRIAERFVRYVEDGTVQR